MRIVAGSAKGRPLEGPKHPGLRPTSDRVRESIFNILGQWMEGLSVLDLFAGTGALAFEALSRGAARAVLVDASREATKLCAQNASMLGFAERVTILPEKVERAAKSLGRQGEHFDLVFADPPYAHTLSQAICALVVDNGLLGPEGTLVVEHGKREPSPERHQSLLRVDQRKFGDTLVSFYRFG